MNVELMHKIVEYAEQEPRRFNMATWYEDLTDEVKRIEAVEGGLDDNDCYDEILNSANYAAELFEIVEDIPPCGAAHCVAGTACILSGLAVAHNDAERINGRRVVSYSAPFGDWYEAARGVLELTHEQAHRLFYPSDAFGNFESLREKGCYWPEPFSSQYEENKFNPQARVRILAERVEHFIKTDGQE